MKKTSIIKIAGVALVIGSLNARAGADWMSSPYLHFDVGASILQDVQLQSINGVKITNPSANINFDPGIRGDVAFGYNLNDQWAVEIEGGMLWNQADSVNGNSISPAELTVYQFPVLVNGIFKWVLNDKWMLTYGIGAGGIGTYVDATAPRSTGFSDTDFTFAYQAQAGVKYSISPNMMVDFSYKFLGSLDHEFTDQGATIKTDPGYNHSLLVSFTWKF